MTRPAFFAQAGGSVAMCCKPWVIRWAWFQLHGIGLPIHRRYFFCQFAQLSTAVIKTSVFDPLCEMCRQRGASGDETVIVVRPACDPAVFGEHHGSPMQREWNLQPVGAKSWFYQGCLKRPFGKHAVAAHKDRIDL